LIFLHGSLAVVHTAIPLLVMVMVLAGGYWLNHQRAAAAAEARRETHNS